MFAPHFPPRRGPEALVNGKLALAMMRRGWNLDVISEATKHPFERETDASFWDLLKEITRGVPVVFPGQTALFLDRIASIIMFRQFIPRMSWARYAAQMAKTLIDQKRCDVLLSRSQPAVGHLPAMKLADKFRMPWIANWNDPDPPIRSPRPYGHGPTAKIGAHWRRYMDAVAHTASWHTFPSERLMNYMQSMYPAMAGKSSAVPHVALSIPIRKRESKGKKFVVCHAGSLEHARHPKCFFEGVALFLSKVRNEDEVEIRLIGNSPSGQSTFTIPIALQRVVTMKGWCSYEETLRIMSEATVLLVLQAPMPGGITLLAKFVDSVQCKRPILAIGPKEGTLSDLLGMYGGGIAAQYDSPPKLPLLLKCCIPVGKKIGWMHCTTKGNYILFFRKRQFLHSILRSLKKLA